MKQKHEFENIVAETLLIPLYMRAKESRREDAILRDEMAEQLVESIDYDYSRFDGAPLSEVGCVIRGHYFDEAVRRFLSQHERAVVVNVGCGLDTRFQRIGSRAGAVFYEMDLPEVIALRRKLIPEPAGDRYLAASILETEWMDELRERHPDTAFLFTIEGVLMYFREEQVKQILHELAVRFAGGEVWLDVCGPLLANNKNRKPDSLKDHGAQIRSGIASGREIERWEPRLCLLDQANYMKFYRHRWPWWAQFLGRFTRLCFRFSSMMGFEIKEKK